MIPKRFSIVPVILMACLLVIGCTKPYSILIELEQPLKATSNCYIGEIEDGMAFDVDEEDKPSLEDMTKFRNYIAEYLVKKEIFGFANASEQDSEYEVVGSLIEYKKGSGVMRFLFGLFGGTARMTVTLGLIDKSTNLTIFSGNFTRTVTSGYESGSTMYKNIAKDFAKALKKQIKNLK